MKTERILIVDDERRICQILKRLLDDAGYGTGIASDGHAALAELEKGRWDLILLDLKMPGMDGYQVMSELEKRQFAGKVVVMTAFGTIPSAVKAIKAGAFDYVTKPFDNDLLLHTVQRALEHRHLESKLQERTSELNARYTLAGIISRNNRMRELFQVVERAAPTTMPVLITGESGTGKELFARAIHAGSERSGNPFVPLNCGALPDNLIESELFGYKKGAFSGAVGDKKGLVEAAEGGTLFLDEIAEMGASSQVKLLRFLEDGQFVRIGGTRQRSVDVRIIAATNRNLQKSITSGSFRQDLFFRLNVISIDIPPLRDRLEDVPLLAEHFLEVHGKETGRDNLTFSEEALRALQSLDWQGNVRELENLVRRLLVLCQSEEISVDDLNQLVPSQPADRSRNSDQSLGELVAGSQEQIERQEIVRALEDHSGNRTHAAEALGIGRNTLLRKIKKYGLA